MRDLLLAQRVSKRFNNTIGTSPRLRRKLYFEPESGGSVKYIDWRLDEKAAYVQLQQPDSPLGPQDCHGKDLVPTRYAAHWGRSRYDAGQWKVRANQLLLEVFPILRREGLFWPPRDVKGPQSTTAMVSNDAMNDPRASWRRMYFTQPPVSTMALEWDSDGQILAQRPGALRGWGISVIGQPARSKGMRMDALFSHLLSIAQPTWILGREMWEDDEEEAGEEDTMSKCDKLRVTVML